MFRALLVSALTLVSTTPAFATLSDVYTGYAEVELESVEPLCPKGVTCMTDGTVVNVRVTYGCAEKLGPVTAETLEKDGKLYVFVAAPVIGEGRTPAACLAIVHETVKFQFIMEFGKVELRPLKNHTGHVLN